MNESVSDSSSDSPPDNTSLQARSEEHKSFAIAGIGASAGGLQAFTELLNALPVDTGMGFVLVQHLDPNHKSLLTELLTKTTRMVVKEVETGMIVEPNQVYILPQNKSIEIKGGELQLMPRTKTLGKNMPIDTFLESLAADLGNKAIGIVLSGMDGDGTLGLEAIKAAGGITFAQSKKSAQFDSMPQTAIAGGYVDFILPPQEIAQELAKISRHPYVMPSKITPNDELSLEPENDLQEIFRLLLEVTGVDFTNYKQSTINRRIKRRMIVQQMSKLEDYIKYLQENQEEAIALYQDFLINVTCFFRDSGAFDVLKQQIFPLMVVNRTVDNPLRVWVAACSTGQEAYSIAICLQEFLEDRTIHPPIKILATDLSQVAIDKARSGVYTEAEIATISEQRRQRFFMKVEGGYRISKQIRDMCIFAKQNINQDPPFSKLDLISCRNVLIYLGTSLQKKVLPIFHYALKPTGFLMLGTAETVGEFSNLFTLFDKKYKIYSRKLAPVQVQIDFAARNLQPEKPPISSSLQLRWSNVDIQKKADQIALSKYAPCGVVVDSNLEIIEFRGQISIYLQPASGQASLNLLRMVQPSLLSDLQIGVHQAKDQNISVRKEGLQVQDREYLREINIDITPFQSPTNECYFLILFEDVTGSATNSKATKKSVGKSKITNQYKAISKLEQDNINLKKQVALAKEYLQSVIEEQEITNEELQSSMEELLSSNEEFQSTNEELETAKEEIQSTNEELKTINSELQNRNQEVTQTNSNLNNLLDSVNIPIVMFGRDLSVRLLTPNAKPVLNIGHDDIGRSLADINYSINLPQLPTLIVETIETATKIELEVQDISDHWYNLRLLPYKNLQNKIDGAVIALTDIDGLKKLNSKLYVSQKFAEAIVNTVREPLLALDPEWRIITANKSFYQTFQLTPQETEQQVLFEFRNGEWDILGLHQVMAEIITKDTPLRDFEVSQEFINIGYKTMLLNACKIPPFGGPVQLILLAIEDITERKQIDQERQQLLIKEQVALKASEDANEAKEEFIAILAHELRNPLSAILAWTQMLRNPNFDQTKTERALETIERSAKLQTKLIEDVLDFSRITTGKLHLNLQPVNLVSIVEAAMSGAQLSAEPKNIQLKLVVIDPAIPRVMADVDRIHQVIWNLLTNAIKFTPNEGMITVKLEEVGDYAQLQVIDTGIGIATEFLPYVFDRYRQAELSIKVPNTGLGLGLALVRYLVDLHEGSVEVTSAGEGQGSTFRVKLPLWRE